MGVGGEVGEGGGERGGRVLSNKKTRTQIESAATMTQRHRRLFKKTRGRISFHPIL